ncbi:MAG: GYD domain-containing protein [Chloroflexi bacterium]|nr:GYD domain-containing protein [Chloroflexota bacterium]MCL5076284.1 GYD domain-containing protein [Chloroflexota bacterium]
MPIFVALGRATEEGMRNLGGFSQRHEQAVKRAESMGGKVLGSYALLGRYDYLVILECPDVETALKVLAREATGGNVRYETMIAIPIEEFAKIVERM